MELENKTIVVTGGGSGVGRAMVERFAAERPHGIAVVDRNGAAARAVVDRVGGLAIAADLCREAEVVRVIGSVQAQFGPIDLFCSNAGIVSPVGGLDVPDDDWHRHWNIHVMAHLWAARALVPAMVERRDGYLLNTASAAGLLMLPGAVPYTVSKHAAVALAESLAVLYRGTGVRFSCLCPEVVETPLVSGVDRDPVGRFLRTTGRVLAPADVAETVVEGLRDERFLILTHPGSREKAVLRANDADAYLDAVAGLWAAAGGTAIGR
ncbi:SDR family oxidoreductase [Actinopolymorpha pittospori]|uniref:NAD(P)-dependent dehydrogenase (Short-subunit alcohol dehydrogenase family) n=1 Tax=Actinopolymorpha pittospori TaxID=648752 RepID=A0A927NB61_9ACTN|nr:SDR family oxidoreductase [Actinopolymorpha pittospori]MBE1611620.1 NAD(P)-dependent dehydrogenase (short-subunit alcohol dehydrogenase family) [Actinopolymorpha pittospori]